MSIIKYDTFKLCKISEKKKRKKLSESEIFENISLIKNNRNI